MRDQSPICPTCVNIHNGCRISEIVYSKAPNMGLCPEPHWGAFRAGYACSGNSQLVPNDLYREFLDYTLKAKYRSAIVKMYITYIEAKGEVPKISILDSCTGVEQGKQGDHPELFPLCRNFLGNSSRCNRR